MVNLVKSYVFNTHSNHARNRHVFLMSRATIGVSLRDSVTIHPDNKFTLIDKLNSIEEYCELDSESFSKLINGILIEIKDKVLQETKRPNNVTTVIDGLIKHFKL